MHVCKYFSIPVVSHVLQSKHKRSQIGCAHDIAHMHCVIGIEVDGHRRSLWRRPKLGAFRGHCAVREVIQ